MTIAVEVAAVKDFEREKRRMARREHLRPATHPRPRLDQDDRIVSGLPHASRASPRHDLGT